MYFSERWGPKNPIESLFFIITVLLCIARMYIITVGPKGVYSMRIFLFFLTVQHSNLTPTHILARAMQADRSASALQQRIVSMEKSLLLSEAGGSDNGALDTKARIFGDAMQNEINALKRRRSDSLKQRRRLNLMIDTEAAKLLKPAREVVRLRKSNADALEKLMTMVNGLSRATPQTRESGPIDALPFSPIRSSASQKDTDFDPDLSPMLRLPSSRLSTYRSAGRAERTAPANQAPSPYGAATEPQKKMLVREGSKKATEFHLKGAAPGAQRHWLEKSKMVHPQQLTSDSSSDRLRIL